MKAANVVVHRVAEGCCMNFLRSRFEQLADYLREHILCGAVAEPLADTRSWSKRLCVSRNTLHAALKILERQRLVSSTRRRTIGGCGVRSGGTISAIPASILSGLAQILGQRGYLDPYLGATPLNSDGKSYPDQKMEWLGRIAINASRQGMHGIP